MWEDDSHLVGTVHVEEHGYEAAVAGDRSEIGPKQNLSAGSVVHRGRGRFRTEEACGSGVDVVAQSVCRGRMSCLNDRYEVVGSRAARDFYPFWQEVCPDYLKYLFTRS